MKGINLDPQNKLVSKPNFIRVNNAKTPENLEIKFTCELLLTTKHYLLITNQDAHMNYYLSMRHVYELLLATKISL